MTTPLPSPPDPIDVEEAFNDCVRGMPDGLVVSDEVGTKAKFANADYLFAKDGVVAELKCMTEDLGESQDLFKRTNKLFNKWIQNDEMPLDSTGQPVLEALDKAHRLQLIDQFRPTIRRRIIKANKQIRETAQHYGIEKPYGLLLLANDGNWTFAPKDLLPVIARTMRDEFSSINTVVLFTLNMASTIQGHPDDITWWLECQRVDTLPPVPAQFMQKLSSAWMTKMAEYAGGTVNAFHIPEPLVQTIKYASPPKKQA